MAAAARYFHWTGKCRIALAFGAGALAALALAGGAAAQELSLDLGDANTLTGRVLQLVALLTVLSLAPSILVMMTSFVRIVVVLSILRTAIGTQQSPPNPVLISLALFLTAFVMAPTFQTAYQEGIRPYMNEQLEIEQAAPLAAAPFKQFMLAHAREKDLALFIDLAEVETPADPAATPYHVVIPAFMISELKRAFEIGFLLFIPFLIIDLVVASVLMAMGMMMLPPIIISLPFKLIFFVLIDGWRLVAGSLVQSYGG
ncbi:MAG: flagellar type III secretion system pore protein FliP [Parvularculaceae bacterium]